MRGRLFWIKLVKAQTSDVHTIRKAKETGRVCMT